MTAARAAVERFAASLRGAARPDAVAIGHWTAAEVGCHVAQTFEGYVNAVTGQPSPVEDHLRLGETWNRMVAADPMRDPGELADRLERTFADLAEDLETKGWEEPVPWHGGLTLPAYSLPCIGINELAIHGRDIATSQGKGWHMDRSDALLSLHGLFPAMPHYLNADAAAGLEADFALHLRGGPTVFAEIHDQSLRITTERPGTIDCHISADPAVYLLVGYGRISQIKPILVGKVVAYGKKPWLGLRFARIFHRI